MTNSHCVGLLRAENYFASKILGAKNVIGTERALTFILKLVTGSRRVAVVIRAIMLCRACEGKRAGCRGVSGSDVPDIYLFRFPGSILATPPPCRRHSAGGFDEA